jgi:uncharacterized protein (TIGR02271 family)
MAEGSTRRWEDEMPRYRARWEQRHGGQGGRWEESEPYHRYSWEMSDDPRYRGRPWAEVEPQLRRDWETRHRDRPWGRAAEAIREAWAGDTGPAMGHAEQGRTVELREEELRARKTPVQAGEVGLHKEVVSEQKTMDVPVTREEAVVERRPVDRRPADRPIGEDESIKVPLREERVEVEKRPVVTEEVEVGKRPVQETERVSGTVRREEARVEGEGDVDVRGDEPRR